MKFLTTEYFLDVMFTICTVLTVADKVCPEEGHPYEMVRNACPLT